MLASGVLLAVIGMALILASRFGLFVELPLAMLWLLSCARELKRLRQGYRRYRRLSLSQHGELALMDGNGRWHAAERLPGGLVLRRFAWIRLRDARGHEFAEPFRGHCRTDTEWRRLQVLWRHIGAAV